MSNWSTIYPLETGIGNVTQLSNTIEALILNYDNNQIDTSPYPKTVNGGSGVFSSSIFKTGTHSLIFNGTRDYQYVNSREFDDFTFGSREFTIQAWIYPTSLSGTRTLISKHANGNYSWMFLVGSASSIWVVNGSYNTITVAFTTNQWQHVAISKVGTNLLFFKDGILQHTFANNVTYAVNSADINIGRNGDNVWHYAGYIDSLKIVRGVGLYTENFTL